MKISMFFKFILFCVLTCASLSAADNQKMANFDKALKVLMEGNQRYINDTPLNPDDLQRKRESMVGKQTPFAIIVGCSDSRVPPEIVFDQSIGDLFVVRVAGNVVGPIEMDSIEFAADKLRVPLIVVLGHQNCGAVQAVLEGTEEDEDIVDIAPFIRPAVEQSKDLPGDPLVNAIKANVGLVVKTLSNYPSLASFTKSKRLKIVGAYYHLESGEVELLR